MLCNMRFLSLTMMYDVAVPTQWHTLHLPFSLVAIAM